MSLRQVQLASANALYKITQGMRLSHALVDVIDPKFTSSEQAQCQDLVYGVLRFSGSLEFFCQQLWHTPPKNPVLKQLFYVALYQLNYTRNAQHAVVHEAVEASKSLLGFAGKKLMNAILRRFLREKDSLQASLKNNEIAYYNLPRWWLTKLQQAYPDKWQSIALSAQQHPPFTLRVNRRITTAQNYQKLLEEVSIKSTILGDYTITLPQAVPVAKLPHFFDGWVSVQDWGAQQASQILNAQDGEYILDACSAPGGKTTHLLEWANCEILALDIDDKRLEQVQSNLDRLHLKASLKTADASLPEQWFDGRQFDAILADVPCTASGVVRRHPDMKWRRLPEDIHSVAQQQAKLLDKLWDCLKPNGRLLLATCSIWPEENEQQKQNFLTHHPNAECIYHTTLLPSEQQDGFYYALFKKH